MNLRPLGHESSVAPFKLSGRQTGQSHPPGSGTSRPPWQPTAGLQDADSLGRTPLAEFNWLRLPLTRTSEDARSVRARAAL